MRSLFAFLFRRGPAFVDEAFAELAQMLTEDERQPTYGREWLDRQQLNYSLLSLKHVDTYLARVHAAPPSDQEKFRIVLRGGAYVGEVMRRSLPEFHWVEFNEGARHSDALASMGPGWGTAAVLWNAKKDLMFPLGKVGKFIENGQQDSVFSFADLLIRQMRGMLVRSR